MAIMTVARELGSISPEQIQRLSGQLGMNYFNKEQLEQRFSEFGVDPSVFVTYDEKKPGIFAGILHQGVDYYLEILISLLFAETLKGPCLFVGRGANFLFNTVPNSLRVRFVASLETRIRNLRVWNGYTEEEAVQKIEESDRHRGGFCRFHYLSDWSSPLGYDLVLRTDSMPPNAILELLQKRLNMVDTPELNAQGTKMIRDRVMAREICKRLYMDERLEVRFLEVQCDNGAVVMKGLAISSIVSARAEEIAKQVPGVKTIDNRLQVMTHDIGRRL